MTSTENADARPVVLVRYRPGRTDRTVHLVRLPLGGRTGAASALCGAVLRPEEIETVRPGHGVPYSPCLVNQIAGTTAPSPDTDGADQGASPDGADYRAWDWPVTLRGDHVLLNLEPDLVALIIPIMLATQVTVILTRRRCPPPVLVHPCAPGHQVLLADERYEVALSWPPGVHRITGTLPLPPTMTPHGPIT